MQTYFVDTSGLAKYYVAEAGTQWVRHLFTADPAIRIVISALTGVELIAAVARRARGSQMAAADARRIVQEIRRDCANWFRVVDITSPLVDQAMDAAETHALRGSDAVQFATAMQVASQCLILGVPFTLISADGELNAAASTAGLTVDDPNTHP